MEFIERFLISKVTTNKHKKVITTVVHQDNYLHTLLIQNISCKTVNWNK